MSDILSFANAHPVISYLAMIVITYFLLNLLTGGEAKTLSVLGGILWPAAYLILVLYFPYKFYRVFYPENNYSQATLERDNERLRREGRVAKNRH